MKLTQLDIKGFKSFPDKTSILFDERVTGIVGPNGCGKSNIIDSIRWVIGEQRTSALRSENLASLIFNGSKTRAASGLAEVVLTFENTKNLLPTEFNTVSIARRFYKNGDSEYLLNNTQCRLKDIQNLFIDTGIGSDSYSIIELGMVDDLIKDKDNSRRKMLEQAAGISIYKERKKEATAKLTATNTDIDRIKDVLFEIEKQIKTLASDAEKAKKHKRLKQQYKEVSVELAQEMMENYTRDLEAITQKENEEKEKIQALEVIITQNEARVESEKFTLTQHETALKNLQHEHNQHNDAIREKEKERELRLQENNFLHTQKTRSAAGAQKAQNDIAHLRTEVARLDTDKEKSKANHARAEQEITALRARTDEAQSVVRTAKTDEENTRAKFKQIENELFKIEKESALLQNNINYMRESVARFEEEDAGYTSKIQACEQKKKMTEESLQTLTATLHALEEKQKLQTEEIAKTDATISEKKESLNATHRELDAQTNAYTLLKNLSDNMEGYPESVRFLHTSTWGKQNALPILSDLLSVDKDYSKAAELILEPYLNYYVTRTPEHALNAIAVLDENKKGRAGFFVLPTQNNINNHNIQTPNTPDIAHATHAKKVVQIDAEYAPLLNLLLEKVYILEDDFSLIPTEYAKDETIIFVDKKGHFLRSTTQLRGGSADVVEGARIGRAKKITELHEQIAKSKENVQALQNEIENLHSLRTTQQNYLQETAREIKNKDTTPALTNKILTLAQQLESFAQMRKTTQAKIQHTQSELPAKTAQLTAYEDSAKMLHKQRSESTLALEAHLQKIQTCETQYALAKDTQQRAEIALAEQKNHLSYVEKDLSSKQAQITQTETLQQSEQTESARLEKQIEANTQKINTLDTQLQTELVRQEEERKKLHDTENVFLQKRAEIEQLETRLRAQLRDKENLEKTRAMIHEKHTQIDVRVAELGERLRAEFELLLEDVMAQPRVVRRALADIKDERDKVQRSLHYIGEVNPNAVVAFEEAQQRFDFINAQQKDLLDARESLLQTISEVEQTVSERFMDTFNRVKENFRSVFKSLFYEEDECDLTLSDPYNIAETKVEVVAKPKGKRPMNITQLSGGEKTLTATALLFAIYLIKPAPFCILDEVDAPLDDTNVDKFLKMIRTFSEQSQFIIVTHNKTTMNAVDKIYGVTMQESGVSKLVEVDFRQLQLQER